MLDLDKAVFGVDNKIEFNTLISPEALSIDEYHKVKGISSSGLRQAYKDPKLYANKDRLLRMPSPALDIGSALHEKLLTPSLFKKSNYFLSSANDDKLRIMVNNGSVMFDYILKDTLNEHSLFVEDNGFVRKVRFDAYDKKNGIIYDLKTSKYNSITNFAKQAYDLGYHIQVAFYIDTLKMAGFKANAFAFLVIPNVSPCEPFALQVTDRLVEDGRAIYTEVVDRILGYEKSNNQVFFHALDLPAWRVNQLGE